MVWLDADLVSFWAPSCCDGFRRPYVGGFVGTIFRTLSGSLPLQTIRAETLVERFTVRMHVHVFLCACVFARFAVGVFSMLPSGLCIALLPSLQAFRAETMVDGLPRAATSDVLTRFRP